MGLIGTRWTPKGPSTNNMKAHRFLLSGIDVEINAPLSNNSRLGGALDNPLNIYDLSNYTDESEERSGAVLEYYLLGRNWYFAGLPIIDGANYGIMGMEFSVSYMPEFASLFRPRRLECAMERYICVTGLYTLADHSRVSYTRQNINGTDWANYICRAKKNESSAFQTVWQTPITDEHLLTIEFSQSACAKDSGLMKAYTKLMKVIMSSITIKLPQDIQALKNKVQEAYPYESFPTFMPPYVFERFEPQDKYDVIRQVSASYNHETDNVPDDIFDLQVEEIMTIESKKKEDVRRQILNNHLRFEELEGEDYQRYLSQQNESATEA